jgi:uncharacterized protein YjdB
MRRTLLVVAAVAIAAVACRSGSPAEDDRLERITLAPREARRSVGEAQHFTATGHYASGVSRNLTQRVRYGSSDTSVAAAANAKGDRSRIAALAPGTAVITATDPTTGVSSHATDGDATITVLGALERITLAPVALTRRVGQTQRLTATGHYAGGTTRNLTQRVTYRSSDAAVVAVPNADGDRSRLEIVGVGRATISAVDAGTGIASTTTGDDATVTAVAEKPSPAASPVR